jgi:hypothetical protein
MTFFLLDLCTARVHNNREQAMRRRYVYTKLYVIAGLARQHQTLAMRFSESLCREESFTSEQIVYLGNTSDECRVAEQLGLVRTIGMNTRHKPKCQLVGLQAIANGGEV